MMPSDGTSNAACFSKIDLGDTLDLSRGLADKSVDLVFCSPPYEDARSYGRGFKLKGEEWVAWAKERFMEHLRISRGAVCWVIEGRTRKFTYSGTPLLLAADLIRSGVKLRKPCVYERDGIPGSGGPDWFKNRYEFIICAAHGRLPWSDPTACGWPPKYKPGGAPSHRKRSGRVSGRSYKPPKLANPGNIIDCGPAGGGRIGDKLAHESEAPFPEQLAERFIRSFCPPGGIVLDGFCGSGTTGAVAVRLGRSFIGHEVDDKMIDVSFRRIQKELRNGGNTE